MYGSFMLIVEDDIGFAPPLTAKRSSRTRTGATRPLDAGTVVRDEDGYWVVASSRPAGRGLGGFDILLSRAGPDMQLALEVMET